jgi:hypothetical protein
MASSLSYLGLDQPGFNSTYLPGYTFLPVILAWEMYELPLARLHRRTMPLHTAYPYPIPRHPIYPFSTPTHPVHRLPTAIAPAYVRPTLVNPVHLPPATVHTIHRLDRTWAFDGSPNQSLCGCVIPKAPVCLKRRGQTRGLRQTHLHLAVLPIAGFVLRVVAKDVLIAQLNRNPVRHARQVARQRRCECPPPGPR